MRHILLPFWNRGQARLRALWRLVLQSISEQLLTAGLALLALPLLGYATLDALQAALLDGSVTSAAMSAVSSLSLVATLATVWLAGRLLDRRRFVTFGFRFDRDWWLDLAFGLGLGAALMGVVFVVELATGWVTVTGTLHVGQDVRAFVPAILTYLLAFVVIGIREELVYRGYQLTNLAEGVNFPFLGSRGAVVVALALSSLIFSWRHLNNPGTTLASAVAVGLGGVMLGIGYVLTGELAISIGLHTTWNFFLGNIFGFTVSGLVGPAQTVSVLAIEQRGPALWTGGEFGPEAGLVGMGAMLLGILLTVGWVRLRCGSVSLAASLAARPGDRPQSESQNRPPATCCSRIVLARDGNKQALEEFASLNR